MRPARHRYAVIVMALYAFIAGGLPVADAMVAGGIAAIGAQIDESPTQHRSSHDHLSCQLCRTMDRNVASDGGDRIVLDAPPLGSTAVSHLGDAAPDAPSRATLRARAPPLG